MREIMEDALKELYKIIDLDTDETEVGWRKRKKALDQWVASWVSHSETSQSVVNTKYLTKEYEDILLYKMAVELSEPTIEEAICIDKSARKITAKVTYLNKKPKKKRF